MTLLARKIGVEEGDPFVALIEPSVFDVAKVGSALIEFRLNQLQRLLGEFEIKAGNFSGGVKFAHVALLLLKIEPDLLALVSQGQL